MIEKINLKILVKIYKQILFHLKQLETSFKEGFIKNKNKILAALGFQYCYLFFFIF